MKRILILLILILLFITGCIYSDDNTNKNRNYLLYGGNDIVIDRGTKKGGTLNLYMRNYQSINPLNPKSAHNLGVYNILFLKLFEVDSEKGIIYELAKSCSYSSNKRELLITLRNDLLWSDGSQITSDDIIYTIKTIKKLKSGYYSKNVEEIDDYVRVNSKSLKILFKKDNPDFIYNFIFPVIPDSSENNIRKFSGPYKIKNDGDTLVLSKNTNWFKCKSPFNIEQNIETIIVNKYTNSADIFEDFNNKEIDFLYVPYELYGIFDDRKDVRVFSYITNEYELLLLNTQRNFYKNDIIKNMLTDILSPIEVLDKINKNSIYITRLPVKEPIRIQLKEYDYINSSVMEEFIKLQYNKKVINILYNSENRDRRLIADRLKVMLEENGFYIGITATDYDDYSVRLINGNYDIAVTGFNMGSLPVNDFVYKPSPRYLTDINNKSLYLDTGYINTELFETGKKYIDSGNSLYLNQITDIIDRELPYVGLYFKKENIVFSSSVKGVEKPPETNYFYGISDWYLEKR
jgi:peptide/nickel transport system substrate-binding protein